MKKPTKQYLIDVSRYKHIVNWYVYKFDCFDLQYWCEYIDNEKIKIIVRGKVLDYGTFKMPYVLSFETVDIININEYLADKWIDKLIKEFI